MDGQTKATLESVERFNQAFGRHDVDGVMRAMADECVFETEEIFAAGDRCVLRWLYRWVDGAGKPGHIRGVDVFRVRDGKVAEKLSYVKG